MSNRQKHAVFCLISTGISSIAVIHITGRPAIGFLLFFGVSTVVDLLVYLIEVAKE